MSNTSIIKLNTHCHMNSVCLKRIYSPILYTDTIFCVDIEKYSPDLVLIDFSVNDYGHPKLMEALLRKIWITKSSPLILLTNLWVTADCPVPRYLLHSFYYEIPLLNICPAVDLCYGKKHMPQYISDQYSKTDGVHPWGPNGTSPHEWAHSLNEHIYSLPMLPYFDTHMYCMYVHMCL